LVNDTVAWRDDCKVAECRLAPLKESESLNVPVELDLFIAVFGVCGTGYVNLD